jgi:hypothetical protein
MKTVKNNNNGKHSKSSLTGWAIAVTTIVFLWMCWDPFMNDREEFLRIFGSIFVGGIVCTLLIMGILSRTLPNVWAGDEEEDNYQKWLEDNTKALKDLANSDRLADQEYSEDNWNKKVRELGPNKNSLTGIASSKGTTIGTYKNKKKKNENRNKK